MSPPKQRPVPSLVTVLLLTTLTTITAAASITFELTQGQRKCFSEDLPPMATVQGTVHVASGRAEMPLDLFVSDQAGKVYFNKHDVNSVKFTFATANYRPHTMEPHRFCILSQVHPHAAHAPSISRRVTLDVKSVSHEQGKKVPELARQEHADKIYSDFLTVSQSVDSLIEKMDDLRAAEQTLTDLNERTATTIVQISVVACLFTIGTGVANFLSLKSFFKRKKLA